MMEVIFMYDIVIIGAGTAGLSAAIYGVRAGKSVLVLEGENYGGQIINSPEVENYPGIAKISGFEFATGLYEQAQNLGAAIEFEPVVRVEKEGKDFIVYTEEREIPCHSGDRGKKSSPRRGEGGILCRSRGFLLRHL